MWKNTQHQYTSEKYKSKPQWVNASHQLEWLLSQRQEITNAGKDVDKRESLHLVGGSVNWCSHCGKQYWGSSKN